MSRTVYVIGHRNPDTDSVCAAIAYAHLKNRLGDRDVKPARAGEIDEETAFVLQRFDVPVPELLTDATGLDLVLVDHNEVGQALPHIDAANVREVWEHHRIGDLRLPEPIVFHCEPVGATATLIAELYFARGVAPTRAMAGIMLASILSDTVGFRSPTTTEKDHLVASRLAPIAGVDAQALAEDMLRIKSAAAEKKTAAQIVGDDFKAFELDGLRVGIAQVEVTRADAFRDRKAEIVREMRAAREAAGLAQVILMITDVRAKGSDLWFVGDRREVFERAFGVLEDDALRLPGCMSRKKQVVPRLELAFVQAKKSATA
jgi:manganese-dependent inorganic pyrophosphatase